MYYESTRRIDLHRQQQTCEARSAIAHKNIHNTSLRVVSLRRERVCTGLQQAVEDID